MSRGTVTADFSRGDLVADLLAVRAERAIEARDAVVRALRPLRTLKVEDERRGVNWVTEEAAASKLTVTMSVREAMALVRVHGPIGAANGDGPVSRLLCAMTVVSRHFMRGADPTGLAARAALMVLRVAVDDCMAYCRPLHDPNRRSHAGRPRNRPVSEG
jgi:hypothetical protein